MARKTKKKGFTIQFELGIGGLFSIGIVVFCLFLWLFLFGVWTGQTLLEPSSDGKETLKGYALDFWHKKSLKRPKIIEQIAPDSRQEPKTTNGQKAAEATHFSLQVAAFRDEAKARTVVLQWRARDYTSFYLAPEQPNGTFFRVFVGEFEGMAQAKKLSESLQKKGTNKYFITLLPLSEKRYP